MQATGTREETAIVDPNDHDSVELPSTGKQWESTHLPILLMALIGVGGLGLVMGAIFMLSPFLARI